MNEKTHRKKWNLRSKSQRCSVFYRLSNPTLRPHTSGRMARISKSKAFTIYEDGGIRALENETPADETEEENDDHGSTRIDGDDEPMSVIHSTDQEQAIPDDTQDHVGGDDHNGEDADDERRESTATSATVSSFPDSYYMTEHEDAMQLYQAYTPPIIRPRFRRPESVRRMQMASPPPYGYRSPRQSILSHSRSRVGTPRSGRSANARESPRMRKHAPEEDQQMEGKQYSLLLLHVSLLSFDAPWSVESMQQLFPAKVMEEMQLLRSKLSDTVLQRGILIPHPREEYELLEERLLEALELREERLTKCGHFHGRASGSSERSSSDGGRGSDSGIGSSSETSDEELCAICQKHIQQSKSGVKVGNKKWMIKVYAANGLMRSSAWAAAWADMERVDVEIMPWISDDVRQKLDDRRVHEEVEKSKRTGEQESWIREVVEEQVRILFEGRIPMQVSPQDTGYLDTRSPSRYVVDESMRIEPPPPKQRNNTSRSIVSEDLPAIYRPSQIPISLLLKNYIFLLAQDRRNLVALVLSVLILFFAIAFGLRTTQLTAGAGIMHAGMQDILPASLPFEPVLHGLPSSTLTTEGCGELETSIFDSVPIETMGIESPLPKTSMMNTPIGNDTDGEDAESRPGATPEPLYVDMEVIQEVI